MTRQRIGLVAGEYPPQEGGLGDYTRELARALLARGHDVWVVTAGERTTDHRPPTTEASSTGPSPLAPGHSQDLPLPSPLPPSPRTRGDQLAEPERGERREPRVLRVVARWDWGAWPTLRRVLEGVDIVHLQYQTAAYSMHPVANALPWLIRRLGFSTRQPRVVTTYHDTRIPYLFPKAGRIRDWATDAPARWSDLTIVTNPADRARLLPVARRLRLIPIGSNIDVTADPARRRDYRARWGIGDATPLLVYFGFVNRAKGADTLMQALARLRATGLAAQLLMLGGQVGASDPTNQAFLAEVRALADSLGVTEAVTWTGFLPEAEVSEALTAADVAALPYREGVSLQRGTLMAALAHGLAIVTTRPPSAPPADDVPSLVDDVNAILVPPDDPCALADAVARLWADPARRARLGEGARGLSAAFGWGRIAEQHEAAYHDLSWA